MFDTRFQSHRVDGMLSCPSESMVWSSYSIPHDFPCFVPCTCSGFAFIICNVQAVERVHPDQVLLGDTPPKPDLSLVVVRWGGEKDCDPVHEGGGGFMS